MRFEGVYLHWLKALKRAGSLHRRQLNGLWPITMTNPNFQHTRRDFFTVLRRSNPTRNCPILLRAFDTGFDGLKFRGGDGQWSPAKKRQRIQDNLDGTRNNQSEKADEKVIALSRCHSSSFADWDITAANECS
jgi:hypothetical protein